MVLIYIIILCCGAVKLTVKLLLVSHETARHRWDDVPWALSYMNCYSARVWQITGYVIVHTGAESKVVPDLDQHSLVKVSRMLLVWAKVNLQSGCGKNCFGVWQLRYTSFHQWNLSLSVIYFFLEFSMWFNSRCQNTVEIYHLSCKNQTTLPRLSHQRPISYVHQCCIMPSTKCVAIPLQKHLSLILSTRPSNPTHSLTHCSNLVPILPSMHINTGLTGIKFLINVIPVL